MTVTAVVERHNVTVELAHQPGCFCDCPDRREWHDAGIGHLACRREAQLIIVTAAQGKTSLPLDRKILGQRCGYWQLTDIDLRTDAAGRQ